MPAEIIVPDWLVQSPAAPSPDPIEADPEAFEREARRRYGRILAASVAASRAVDAARAHIARDGAPADATDRFADELDAIGRDHGEALADDEVGRAIFQRDFEALARHRLAEFRADADRRERDGFAQALADRFDGLRALAGSGDDDLRAEALRQAALEAHRAQSFGLVGDAQAAFDDFVASLVPASGMANATAPDSNLAGPAPTGNTSPADRVALARAFAQDGVPGTRGLLVPIAKKRLGLPGGGDALATEGAPAGPRGGGASARSPERPAPPRPDAPRADAPRGDRALDEAASAPLFKPGRGIDAETANRRYPNYDPQPYSPGTTVREVTLSRASEPGEFVRVHVGEEAEGKWLVRKSDIEGLSPSEIKRKLALPAEPTRVSDVRLPQGTKLRVGAINKGGDGVIQFEVQGKLRKSWFENTREIAQ